MGEICSARLAKHRCVHLKKRRSFLGRTPSIATAMASQYCEIMVLDYNDFTVVAGMFPSLHKHLKKCQADQLLMFNRFKGYNTPTPVFKGHT